MDPVTLGVLGGMAAAGAIMQWYNAEQARGAAREQLARIEQLFNELVPPQYDIKVFDDPKLLQGIPDPVFNTEAITPEVYQVVEKFQPEAAPFVAEAKPEVVQASAAAQEGRGAQMDVLRRYQDMVRQEGFDPTLVDQYNIAGRRAQQEAQSRSASILQDAARRGQAGSGAALAAQLQAGSDVMEREAMQSADLAKEAYMNKLRAMQESSRLGGDVRQSEMSEASRNADIINSFNQRASARYQDWLNQQQDIANQAKLRNIEVAQRTGEMNVGARTSAAREARDLKNKAAMDTYNIGRQKNLDRLAMAEAKNQALGKAFDDKYRIASGRAGVATQGMQTELGFAKDRGQQIQSAMDTGTGIYKYGREEDMAEKERKAKYGSAYGE